LGSFKTLKKGQIIKKINKLQKETPRAGESGKRSSFIGLPEGESQR
jgi:hypothetical protein